jgi:hypothetical protein
MKLQTKIYEKKLPCMGCGKNNAMVIGFCKKCLADIKKS